MSYDKDTLLVVLAVISASVTSMLGGWDYALRALIICMVVDYISGIVVAGVFHTSPKSEHGSLQSSVGFLGLFRKGMMLLVVLISHQLDAATGMGFIRDCAIFGFLANELISIIENAGLMGVPIPEVLKNAVALLQERAGGDKND